MSHSNATEVSDAVLETLVRRGTVYVYVSPKVGEDPHWQDEHVEPLEGSQGVAQFLHCLSTYADYRLWLDTGVIYQARSVIDRQDVERLRLTFIRIWGDVDHPQFYT